MALQPGQEWGSATTEDPDLVVRGDDSDLAAAVADCRGLLIRFEPDARSDLARSVGLRACGAVVGRSVPMDLLRLDDGTVAVNMVIVGTPPTRLRWSNGRSLGLVDKPAVSSLVVANGQFYAGVDLVPRGHPGDGRAEVHSYRLHRRERSAMRRRLGSGAHLPHPRIDVRSVTEITVSATRAMAVEADGVVLTARRSCRVELLPSAYRLLL